MFEVKYLKDRLFNKNSLFHNPTVHRQSNTISHYTTVLSPGYGPMLNHSMSTPMPTRTTSAPIPLLYSSDGYHAWYSQLHALLMLKKLWTVASREEEVPTALDGETGAAFFHRMQDYVDHKYQAIGLILRCLHESLHTRFDTAAMPKELLQAIEDEFKPNQASRLLGLAANFFVLAMEPSQDLSVYFSNINQVTNKLNTNKGYQVGDHIVLLVTLRGLPPEYDTVWTVLQMGDLDGNKVQAQL